MVIESLIESCNIKDNYPLLQQGVVICYTIFAAMVKYSGVVKVLSLKKQNNSSHKIINDKDILSVRTIEPKKAQYSPFPKGISPLIIAGLQKVGIKELYSHQAEAIGHILAGRNMLVTTSTSSGKSLIYTIPILNEYLKNQSATALYLTPAKALGQNQRKTISDIKSRIAWPDGHGPELQVCDGDTPSRERKRILNSSNIIITTPDMLHATLLPRHQHWPNLFKNLRYVVIDEAHIYRGVFGNHVCHVFRRLRRICAHYNSHPIFILATATIANPDEFGRNLIGAECTVVNRDTSPSGKKEFVFCGPTGLEKGPPSYIKAGEMMVRCIESGHRVIVFGRSRKMVEQAYRTIVSNNPDLENKITPYKGTYTPELRRRLETELFTGKLKGVIATNALELGIDIGDLDVCILAGFPGSISSTWQQSGRAGRKGQDAMIVLIANEDPLEMYLVRHPNFFFDQPCERAVVNPDKLQFMVEHLIMAGHELPLTREDTAFWTQDAYFKAVKFLHMKGMIALISDAPRAYRTVVSYERFSLRGESEKYRAVTEDGEVLEEYEQEGLLTNAHPGAILTIMGKSYLVKQVDLQNKVILLTDVPRHLEGWSTRPILEMFVTDIYPDRTNEKSRVRAYAGTLTVVTSLTGYELVTPKGERMPCDLPQNLPPLELKTTGMWINFANADYQILHTIEHLLRIVIPWMAMCDRNDIGSYILSNSTDGTIFLYDQYEGGVGLAESVLERIDDVLERCYEIIRGCPCKDGCPSCIHIPKCPSKNEGLDKRETISYFAKLLGQSVSQTSVSIQHKQNRLSRSELRFAARAYEQQR
jgi:DEAD/DEAH box helicase domain-containing protein